MSTAPVTIGTTCTAARAREVADDFVAFLETGVPPFGLFASDVFCDFTMPRWRLQARGVDDVLALRRAGHPAPGRVPRSRFDATTTGFVLEVEEQWEQDGQPWYCRELFRADVRDGSIRELSVYCTGDWDRARVAEHARSVELLRA
ncbi:hypothetical protein ACFVZ3_10755 [Kitasatospora purpeofusca]|uniref:hypothetical protein n=1 Tax=Kitasatospora purpeofusca TaxID=67352 RepID=UPI0036A1234C|nr:hypothetical protein KPHV_82490 [Kitasatospora purpeofusca]